MTASDPFGFGSSIPVLRMLSEAETRSFYLDFLGYAVDWEHRFTPSSPASPLYMQVRRGDSVLHLDGHADETRPVGEVRIPVHRLEDFARALRDLDSPFGRPEAVDPRYTGRNTDLNLRDPSGNLLTFWLAADGR